MLMLEIKRVKLVVVVVRSIFVVVVIIAKC